MKPMKLEKGHYYYFSHNRTPNSCYRALVKINNIEIRNHKNEYYGHCELLIEDTIGWDITELYLEEESFVHEVKPIRGKVTKETHPEYLL